MKIEIKQCKTALSPSKLPGYEYALNPYRGCQHGCVYCYAPYVLHEERKWGSFIDVRANMPRLLSRELKKQSRGVVGISTVTDPYQPAEKKFEVTRRCLKQLLKQNFPISIQTKSDLLLRDLDLIERFKDKEVGFTITTLDNALQRRIEPHASSAERRLSSLVSCKDRGIKTYAFIGPILPSMNHLDSELEEIIDSVKNAGVDMVYFDKLNLKPGMQTKLSEFFATNISDTSYATLKKRFTQLCDEKGLNTSVYF